jgi:hypothetical protein
MAESRYKIKGVGIPFDPTYSSCSELKPAKFDWSVDSGDFLIHVDRGLFYRPDSNLSRDKIFGWVCESRYIIPDVYNFLINNHKVLFNNFYSKIFTCDRDLIKLDSRFVFNISGSSYPWIAKSDWGTYNKKKICSMFCSPKQITEGHRYRHEIAKMALASRVDVFGGAHGTKRTVVDPNNPWRTKIDGVRDYMFSIVMENGIYDDYWTEKLTDCFASGTIPVYWGTKNIPDIFDKDGIIWLETGKEQEIINSLSEDLFLSKKKAIQHNLDALQQLKLADDYLMDNII